MKRIYRKVTSTDTYNPRHTISTAFNIVDTLECGHQIVCKGSRGFAKKRLCKTCDSLRNGAVITTGNCTETWDAKSFMPKKEYKV